MTLRLGVETNTVLRPVEFKLYYEFVETKQEGEAFLPAYLSHQTALNLFSAPNLPRPFVSSSSSLLLGKAGGGGISNIVTGSGASSSSRVLTATGASGMSSLGTTMNMNNNKRSNAKALRLTSSSSASGESTNANAKNNDGMVMMMNTASSSSVSLSGTSADVGISGVSSFTASRLSSDVTLLDEPSSDRASRDGGGKSVVVGLKGNNMISDGGSGSSTSTGAVSSFPSSGISGRSGAAASYLLSSSSSGNPAELVAAAAQVAASVSRESLPISPKQSCSRIFRTQNRAIQAGSFNSPRNVFFFGRGGVRNLTCIYRFQGGHNERVRLTIDNISLAGG